MAKCGVTNIGGGGGIGSDEVSAAKENVLSGKTYVGTDTGDEIGTGTMANNGATANQSLNAGSSFLVKKGYHAQDFSVGANSLASQTSGTASAGQMLSGKTAWINGNKITGTIPYQNADVSGTDRAWATNISCWEGTACFGVRNAHYLYGVNWIQGNIPNFYAGNIKKGVNIGGVVGTFQGYVPTATDLYLRGNTSNTVGSWLHRDYTIIETGQITIKKDRAEAQSSSAYGVCTKNKLNLKGYNYINVEFTVSLANPNVDIYLDLLNYESKYNPVPSIDMVTSTSITLGAVTNRVISLPIASYQGNYFVHFGASLSYNKIYRLAVYRIWLS